MRQIGIGTALVLFVSLLHSSVRGQSLVTTCGTLVQGAECVLFAADFGGTFVLDNLGDFEVGAYVHVTGRLEPDCVSICQEGDGCIFETTIESCHLAFEACGTIAPGAQCPIFVVDSGDEYYVENLGDFQIGDRVRVRGNFMPECFTICQPGAACIFGNTIAACNEMFSGCGELVRGVECTLFQADSGELYAVFPIGDFEVGDRIHVTGEIDPECITICQQGQGCILNATTTICCEAGIVGDTNCDGQVNNFDIDPFVAALIGGPVEPCGRRRADANCDGQLNNFDIDPFVALLGQ